MKSEKGLRRYHRVYFEPQNNISASLSVPEKDTERVSVPVLNLSAGGIFFTWNRENPVHFQSGDSLVLLEISGLRELEFLTRIEMKVVWVLDHAGLNHIGYGCEFQNIPDPVRDRINRYVEDRYADGTLRVD
jgi:c-di-GMP-binding flagellar brake protein YcgR